uniref:Ephrin RBD domain-containing protein n=1 Tax=Malurus cyaneus samueli TaxID=2593467 RepID=A0A8C5TM22_9PASS
MRGAGGVRSLGLGKALLPAPLGTPSPTGPPASRLVLPGRFLRDDYSIQVAINDYLDIYCPHYEGAVPAGRAETFTLFMVDREGYRGCYETPGAFKRWECNRPRAPFGPIKFSEKFQRYSAFSLGYEFRAGQEYYYISTPTHNHHRACLKMKVFVCCASSKYPRAHPGGCGRAGAAWPAGGSPIPPGRGCGARPSRECDSRPLSPSTASHSGEKLAPTLPQFTLRPEVKIEDLGE